MVPRPMSAAPRKYLIVAPGRCPRRRLLFVAGTSLWYQAAARGTARCAPQVLGREVQAIARDAARCLLQVLARGARTLLAATLVVRRKCLINVTQADARGAAKVLNRGAQVVASGAAPCASQVLDRCARPFSATLLVFRRR